MLFKNLKTLLNSGFAALTGMLLFIFFSFGIDAFGFSIEIPEHVQKKSEEEQTQWLKQQMKEGREEQLKVGEERYHGRMDNKKQVAGSMIREAEERRRIIREAKELKNKREQDYNFKSQLGFIVVAILMISAGILYFSTRKTKVKVPDIDSDSKENLIKTQELMQKLHKKDK